MEIQGFPNYLIFRNGSVLSKGVANRKPRFLKPSNDSKGYPTVSLGKEKIKRRIHRLLALHFIPNPLNLEMVDHINQVRNDNRLENLRWFTRSDNARNIGMRADNTTGYTHISKKRQSFAVDMRFGAGNRVRKVLPTLQEAIEYRDEILKGRE